MSMPVGAGGVARRGRVRHRGWAAFSQEGTQQQRAGLLPADATANGGAAAAVVAKDISEASAAAARSMRQPSCSMVPWGRPARRIGACCGAPAQHAAAAPLVRLWKGVLFRTFFAGGAQPTHCAALLKTPAPSRRCRGRRPRKHQTEAERREPSGVGIPEKSREPWLTQIKETYQPSQMPPKHGPLPRV